MTGTPQPGPPGGEEATAAEYVLGLLPVPERQAFEARLARDPALAREVASWCACFAALTADISEVAPPASLWPRLEARLHGAAQPPLWRQLLPYLLGAVLAAGLAWAAMVTGLLGPALPDLRADLRAGVQGLEISLDYAAGRRTLTVHRTAGAYPPDQVLQLWMLSDSAEAPVPLGIVAPEGPTDLVLERALAGQISGATLALSLEPPGGAPDGRPTGPVIALGKLAPL
ncbi:anti-sigma factor [Salipiger mangrovisoli]|uniref:Regulator of SigK n=1 Tax=Salipiger mangrovisoli TaxID=2865933 RepID=A0ABR9X4D6_9RHOB|nr:anti-sigma factor [Salipiger mangrovisoli]MBE9638406.1 anti-sigma factor [Salipiger mangrovisoli]